MKNTIIYSIGEIFPKLISFILLPVFTLYLSASDYGIISYTNSVMFFFFVLSSLALNTYLLREYFECKTEIDKKKLIGSVFLTILIINVVMLAMGYILGPLLVKGFNIQIPFFPFFSLLLLNNFCEALSIVPLVVYRVHENALSYVTLSVLKAVLLFVVTYILIVHLKWGLMGNFYGRLFVNAFFIIIYIYVILRNAKINFNVEAIKKSLRFSFPLIPGAIGYLLMSMSDRIILERYVSLSDIGIYSVAYTLAYSLSVIIQGGYRSFEPEIYREFNKPTFASFVERIHKLYMFTVFFLAIVLSVFSRDILLLMTKGDFVKGYTLIPLILIGVIATAQNAILVSIVISEKNTKLSGVSTVVGGGASIAFNLILIPTYGIYAAALASAIAYILMNLIVALKMKFKSPVIQSDVISLLYFMFISFVVIAFFGQSNINIISIIYKFGIIIISLIILFLVYKLNLRHFDFIFSFLKKRED
ncbi:oligosaccharide flippase family protein [Pedobacter panaciterrae]|uniref:lipopolysaccharide biosynthesis protein n=1 Tax=Pedobacter panaciterrae TaxID=363849 RepID=UPI00155DBFB3|nr:oligosaccharide flippase family protein [Pedobacter panaciterrae]NQX55245.1 oligosaccharide flippase family protein [Pedobacter panaciterrae]